MATNSENASIGMFASIADPHYTKAVVVGLYGVPGSSKAFLLDQLKEELGQDDFVFYEGFKMIATLLKEGRKVKTCAKRGRVAVVTGHFMFWPEDEARWQVCAQNDLDTFTHILYLDIPVEVVAQRRLDDWQQAEKTELRRVCRNHRILFSLISPHPIILEQVSTLLHDFRRHTEKYNLNQAESRLNEVVAASEGRLKAILKVLGSAKDDADPLKTLFDSPLLYSYTAFRQAVLLYKEIVDDEAICQDVASFVAMYPEFVSLLQLVVEQEHVGAVVVTCKVAVIGGGRIAYRFIVTGAVKAALVAHQAIFVVSEEQTRSKTIDVDLFNTIYDGSLQACQVVLPSDASPRLDTKILPLIQLTLHEFANSVLQRRRQNAGLQVLHAKNRNTAELLMTLMRDARNAGPVLREAHHCVEWYLATEFLASVIEYSIPHVQGHQTSGHWLCNERKTLIVALIRGGEAMALGGQHTVVLVNSVVNSSKTVSQFVKRIRNLHATIRIMVVTSVVQAQSISGGSLAKLARHAKLYLITLRLSDNKFTSTGITDPGNRLFNRRICRK
ncbi:hypothetical protein DL95DRAFT_428382 [Leptodontidium sp. 2 PMI_412]|nr:hypothetical protein DL95DRAFT_428382 [Leptodontidium sp. 2 PMI_412]